MISYVCKNTRRRRNRLSAILGITLAILGTSARADVIGTFGPITLETSHVPSPNLPGFSTWKVTATSAVPMQSFQFSGTGTESSFGFFGPLNQVYPAGIPTSFRYIFDAFFGIPLDLIQQDSHFIPFPVISPTSPDLVEDLTTRLRANFSIQTPVAGPLDIARLVIADSPNSLVSFQGRFGFTAAANQAPVLVSGQIVGIPEPASASLIILALLVCCTLKRCRIRFS